MMDVTSVALDFSVLEVRVASISESQIDSAAAAVPPPLIHYELSITFSYLPPITRNLRGIHLSC